MKHPRENRVAVVRYCIAAFGGLLLTAAFPNINFAGAAWIAPAVILFSAVGAQPRQAFKLGYVAGLAHFLTSLYWLLNMPYTFHGLPLAPALGWFGLSAYCALFPAIWVWLCWQVRPPFDPAISIGGALENFLSIRGWQKQAWFLCCAVIWVALEMVRGRFLSGFPWNFLGDSQYRMLPVIQIASITGVYGLSFLIIWTSTALGAGCLRLARQPLFAYGPWADAGLPLIAAIGVAIFGASRIKSMPPAQRRLRVALVQPSMPQNFIFDPRQDAARFARAMSLSEEALADKPDLLVWPESGLPPVTPEIQSALTTMITRHRIWMIVSADDEKIAADGTREYFNASFLLGPTGVTEQVYHKRRLVIFGEYVPLAKWLPFLKWLTPVDVGYTPGSESVQFQARNPWAKLSVLICFEDVFPQEAREHVLAGTDFLVNLTNDGWFGEGAEQWQQAASAVFRAVENGLPLVRCTNNGVTCWIDAQGRLRQILGESGDGSIYKEGFMIADIPLRAPGDLTQTFYNLHGDWFGWSCVGIGGLLCANIMMRKRPKAPWRSSCRH